MHAITLEKVATIAKGICIGAQIDIVRNDYDDYGCECYVRIIGECASLIIEEKLYNTFVCRISGNHTKDLSSAVSYHHSGVRGGIATLHHHSEFITSGIVEDFEAQEIEEISKWLADNAKYLKASSELFQRVEYIYYPDLRGGERGGNGIISYDRFIVCDEDFYTVSKIKDTNRNKIEVVNDKIDPNDFY